MATQKELDELKALEQRRAKVDAEIARKRKAIAEGRRRADTHRKIVIGAIADQLLESGKIDRALFVAEAEKLQRDIDRAIFGLPPLSRAPAGDVPLPRIPSAT